MNQKPPSNLKLLGYIFVGLVSLGLCVGVTIPKVWRMMKIRGWVEGAIATEVVVTDSWHQTKEKHPKNRETFWIAWDDADIHQRGPNRIILSPDLWAGILVGSTVEIIRFPDDPHPYHAEGIFASNGNFVFDAMVLTAWFLFARTGYIAFRRLRRRNLQGRPAPKTRLR
ncbi:MAG: hypothetical protein ACPG31_10235 [Planctomycetota bacterium]